MFIQDYVLPGIVSIGDKSEKAYHSAKDLVTKWWDLPTANSSANTLMIDIETGGLSRNAPILQYASYNMKSKAFEANIENVVPVAYMKEGLDPAVGKTSTTWSVNPVAYTDRAKFTADFGTWALNKPYGLDEFFKATESMSVQEIADLKMKMLNQDNVELAGKLYKTPRGIAKQLLLDLKTAQVQGLDLMAANLPFESIRLGQLTSSFLDSPNRGIVPGMAALGPDIASLTNDPDIVAAFGKPMQLEDFRAMFSNVYNFPGKLNVLDSNIADYINESRRLEAAGQSNMLHKLYPILAKQGGPGSKVINKDLMDFTRMVLSGAQSTGLTKSTKDVYTGTTIDLISRMMYGVTEEHLAASDNLLQAKILEAMQPTAQRLWSIDKGLQPNASFSDYMKSYFSSIQGAWKQDFQSTLRYAAARHVDVDLTDDISGLNYKGSFLDVAKRRNVDRSLLFLNESLDQWLNPGSNPSSPFAVKTYTDSAGNTKLSMTGEQFTVTRGAGTREAVDWIDNSTNKGFKEYRAWVTDKDLPSRTYSQYTDLVNSGMDSSVARATVERSILEQYSESRAIASSDLSMGVDELEARYKQVSGLSKSTGLVDNFLSKGDKEFQNNLYEQVVTKAKGLDIQYGHWLWKNYKRPIIATGTAMGLVAFGAARAAGSLYESFAGTPADSNPYKLNTVDFLRDQDDRPEDYDRVYSFEMTGGSSFGSNRKELYETLAYGKEFTAAQQLTLDAGTAMHEYYEVEKLRSGSAKAAEQYVSDSSIGISSFIDIVDSMGRPGDIKSASPGVFNKIQAFGPNKKNVSQVNLYMAMTGQKEGFLEYRDVTDPERKQSYYFGFNEGLFRQDLSRLQSVRKQIVSEMESGQLNPSEVPMTESMGARALENIGRREGLANQASSAIAFAPTQMKQFAFRMAQQARYSGQDFSSLTPKDYKAKQYAYKGAYVEPQMENQIEALGHSGIAWELRQAMTDFGSGYKGIVNSVFDELVASTKKTIDLNEMPVKQIVDNSSKSTVTNNNMVAISLIDAERTSKRKQLMADLQISTLKESMGRHPGRSSRRKGSQ